MEDNGSISASTITWKDIEKALIKIMEEGFRARYKKDSKFIKEYASYVRRLQRRESGWIYKKMLFPDKEAYMVRYRKWYANKKNLLESVENLYKLYYELSKE